MKTGLGFLFGIALFFGLEGCDKEDLGLDSNDGLHYEKVELYVARHCEVNGLHGVMCEVGNKRVCKAPMPCKVEADISGVLEGQYSTDELADLTGEEVTNEVVLNYLREVGIIY